MGYFLPIIAVGLVAILAVAAIVVALRPIRAVRQAEQLARIQRDFHRQREQLEAKFIDRAAATGKPRGLLWSNVAFDDDVIYVRDRRNQSLKAAATAEFVYDGTRWCTAGRVYFNLAPSAAVKYLSANLELVAEEHAAIRS